MKSCMIFWKTWRLDDTVCLVETVGWCKYFVGCVCGLARGIKHVCNKETKLRVFSRVY
jgi:hypothetical protein